SPTAASAGCSMSGKPARTKRGRRGNRPVGDRPVSDRTQVEAVGTESAAPDARRTCRASRVDYWAWPILWEVAAASTQNRRLGTIADLKPSVRNSHCYFQTVRQRLLTLIDGRTKKSTQ